MAGVKSKYQLCTGFLRARITSSTREFTVMGAIPGGALKAFCEPLKQMSTRSRSTFRGMPASVATVSATSSAPSSSATFRYGPRCSTTPVDVPALARASHVFRVHRPAKRRRHADHLRRSALRDHGHPLRKHSVRADDALVAFFQHIEHSSLDPARTRR